MASLGPSERLLRRFLEGEIAWRVFEREYRAEMKLLGAIDSRSRTIKNHGQKFTLRLIKHLALKGNVTLLCHCAEDESECHRHILKRLIESKQV